ncbi:MAG: hypothetical protein LBN29_11280 [Mediterranea sp.]|jgi:hypothetical protein|nr:hypothetical protein [Mediterranea sp.]
MDNKFENIVPWNGERDTGRDVRLKLERNFGRTAANFVELQGYVAAMYAELEDKLSKAGPDATAFVLSMLGGARFGQFTPGIETGTGASVDERGNAEFQSLAVRSFLKVPQLIYNKVRVTGGETWNTEGASIKDVTADGDNAYILALDIEEGDHIGLAVDDICRARYNYGGGFITIYFRVTAVNDAAKSVRIVLGASSEVPGGENFAPVPGMNVARYGSFTVRDRQRSQYFSSNEGCIVLLDGVDSYIISPGNYRGVLGNVPRNLYPDGLPIDPDDVSVYVRNVVAENFFQVDGRGKLVKTIRDRGLWTPDPDAPYLADAATQDEVWHLSCKYRCIVTGTRREPAYNSTDWLLVSGDTTLSMRLESSAGEVFLRGQLSTRLTATVRRGVNDITASIPAADWRWTRRTGDDAADDAWNAAHAGVADGLDISDDDVPPGAATALFSCRAYVADNRQTLKATFMI